MWMPRVRFTVRRMMVAVAIAGLLLGGETMRRRWRSCRDEALRYSSMEQIALEGMADNLGRAESYRGRAARERETARLAPSEHLRHLSEGEARWLDSRVRVSTLQAEIFREEAQWLGRLARRYERAARAPWLPVAPDPPQPE